MQISVVLSTLGNYDGLGRVLDGYERQHPAPDGFEVIVVVDAAEPDLGAADAAIGCRPYPVRRLRGAVPGLSANRNAGWRAATAALVLFADNDTLPEPQLVAEHIEWHTEHPAEEVAVLGHVRWARKVHVTSFMHWLDHGIQFDYPSIEGIEAGWARFYGANVSLKRSFIERVGGFDERRLPYLYDDLDFGYRASKLGLRVLYNRRATVEHLREVDLPYWQQRMDRAATAEREFVRKHPELEPYFFRMFSHAAELEPASGRGRHLIRLVPRSVPWLGERVWTSADLYYRQQLAPYFLEAWERQESESAPAEGRIVAPYLLDRDAVGSPSGEGSQPGGSSPGGPK
ncbi:MAG: glycosyltransferase family 2 protein [Solirubrobacterales bacterium]